MFKPTASLRDRCIVGPWFASACVKAHIILHHRADDEVQHEGVVNFQTAQENRIAPIRVGDKTLAAAAVDIHNGSCAP